MDPMRFAIERGEQGLEIRAQPFHRGADFAKVDNHRHSTVWKRRPPADRLRGTQVLSLVPPLLHRSVADLCANAMKSDTIVG
jgi:hypothetical protein